jgi:hypothetical protein
LHSRKEIKKERKKKRHRESWAWQRSSARRRHGVGRGRASQPRGARAPALGWPGKSDTQANGEKGRSLTSMARGAMKEAAVGRLGTRLGGEIGGRDSGSRPRRRGGMVLSSARRHPAVRWWLGAELRPGPGFVAQPGARLGLDHSSGCGGGTVTRSAGGRHDVRRRRSGTAPDRASRRRRLVEERGDGEGGHGAGHSCALAPNGEGNLRGENKRRLRRRMELARRGSRWFVRCRLLRRARGTSGTV